MLFGLRVGGLVANLLEGQSSREERLPWCSKTALSPRPLGFPACSHGPSLFGLNPTVSRFTPSICV
jgi:hypothetical protein